ncbi:MAG: hypothetical protein OXR73_01345 [Myxococcales bacterium]|nr:hypothetical protein [Myxococcales bacterium]
MDALQRAEGLKRERFQQAWRAIGARDGHAFRTVQECYGEPHRAYHGQAHIAECLAWLDQLWEHARRPAELEIAIYFHDVVYDPGAADNEARSAALFSTLALDAGARPEAIERIALLIQSTREHVAEGGGRRTVVRHRPGYSRKLTLSVSALRRASSFGAVLCARRDVAKGPSCIPQRDAGASMHLQYPADVASA